MQSPTSITDPSTYWLRCRDVSDADTIADDGYFDRHDVTRWNETTDDDRPTAENAAVRSIDSDALDETKLIGKWQVLGSAERIDALWPDIVADAEAGTIWAAKAMTETGYRELPYDEYMIVVYTPNYFDLVDVDRVREHLRDVHGVTRELFYKPDIYTAKGIVAETAAEFGLSAPARYIA